MNKNNELGKKQEHNRLLKGLPLMALALLLSPLAVRAEDALSVLSWIISDGNVTISDCDTYAHGTLEIPSSIEGYPVTTIGSFAFLDCFDLTSITLPEGVTSIGGYAFWSCSGLTSITLPEGVTSIGENAFKSTYIPTTTANDLNFLLTADCAILTDGAGAVGHVVIPDNINELPVRYIADAAFRNCSDLSDIEIPNSVTNIGEETFRACTNLVSITIPDSVASIGNLAFDSCINLTNVTIPDSVIDIGNSAFRDCSSLTSLIIPDTTTSMGRSAFADCSSLTNVFLGKGITNIGLVAFQHCVSLPEISVDPENEFFTSQDGVLFNKELTMLIQCPDGKQGSYVIPGSVTNIALTSFRLTSLTDVTIPASVTSIGRYAFEWSTDIAAIHVDETNPAYSSLEGVLFNKDQTMLIQYPSGKTNSNYSIPEGTAHIGAGAFAYSLNLSDIVIADSVTNIAFYALRDCYGLTSVVIPDSVSSFGSYIFRDCNALEGVFFAGNIPSLDDENIFTDVPSVIIYYQPHTSGWGSTFSGRPTVLWNPEMQLGSGYGATTNGYSFNITGTADIPIAIEACTNLADGIWIPLQTGTLSGGSLDFTDPDWTNYPARVYRIAAP